MDHDHVRLVRVRPGETAVVEDDVLDRDVLPPLEEGEIDARGMDIVEPEVPDRLDGRLLPDIDDDRIGIDPLPDAILAEENAGAECMELCIRMGEICDEAYPSFKRAIEA